jgi:PncC family amidohydrolase
MGIGDGDHGVGVGPMSDATAAAIVERLNGRLLACAESCTAGRLSAEFAVVGGAVDWFRGGLVAYQTASKRSLLAVTAPDVVSEQAATEMAAGVARLFDAGVTVATTGVIGDTPQDGVPPGTVIIATSVDATVRVCRRLLEGSSEDMCDQAIGASLEALLTHLEAHAT